MNVSFLSKNIDNKYRKRQADDIKTYGKATPQRKGVKDVLDIYTPHRRLSKKPCSLSDNKYFLDKYEKLTKDDLAIIIDWDRLTDEEKIDYIVKHRYKKLVTKKILADTQPKQNEYNYMLGENGEIMALDIGDEEHVDIKNGVAVTKKSIKNRINAEEKPFVHIDYPIVTTSVHNHPEYYTDLDNRFSKETQKLYDKHYGINKENQIVPFSIVDIIGDTQRQTEGYVIDSKGHIFHFVPKHYDTNSAEKWHEFENKATEIEKELEDNYEYGKIELDLMTKTGKYTPKEIKEQQFAVFDAYGQLLKEGITREKYRELLKSDYFKENIGDYEEL